MQYNVVLKDNNQKAYKLFVWFLFFLQVVAAGIFVLKDADKNVKLSIYILLAFYAVISLFYFLVKERKNALETFALIMALLYASFWLKHLGVIALLIFAAIYLFVTVVQKKKTALFIKEDGIHFTRVFKTIVYNWGEMDNVILKDNLLTIDFKSNKLIQAEIVEDIDVIDENKFNLFCSRQIKNNV